MTIVACKNGNRMRFDLPDDWDLERLLDYVKGSLRRCIRDGKKKRLKNWKFMINR